MKRIFMHHTINFLALRGSDVVIEEGETLIEGENYIILKS